MNEAKNFAWPVTTLCKYDYKALKEFVKENEPLFKSKQIVIFGAGIRGTSFSIFLQKIGYHNIVFTDNNEQKIGGYINEFPIISYEEMVKRKEEIVIIISVENGFSIMKQLEKDNFQEGVDFFYIENHLYDLYLKEFLEQKKTETLIMGDCGITDISRTDSDYTNLGEILKEKLGSNKTKVLAVHAMGMRAFYHILKAHIENIEIPRRAIVMTNFETFTGKQHLLPRSQHARLIDMISKSISDSDEELREYVEVTKERFDNFKVDYFASSKNTLNKMSKDKNDRIVIRMNYMYELKEDNECIVYMKKIISLCNHNNIKLLFFIPPANYMYAEELYGDKFKERYSANVKKLKDIINSNGAEILDLSYLLESDKFADVHTIDETTNYEGRKIVAGKIVGKIETME